MDTMNQSTLADPTRRAILAGFARGETETLVTQLAVPFKMGLPVISKHLKVPGRAGLIALPPASTAWRRAGGEP